ncbi:amino acid adenylation domain-containing protein, partial [Thermosporothrix hazakensis]
HELIEEQVSRTPEAKAVSLEGEWISYRELNERANRLAHLLRRQGVGAEELVGVYMRRSIELVVSVLAIWKAGGAYMPLEPEYPLERIRGMVEEAKPRVVLVDEGGEELERMCGVEVWSVRREKRIAEQPVTNPQVRMAPENLAYVIYTSGSTGRPKGAMNSHRAICNRLYWMQQTYPLSPEDKVLQKTPFSFDVSVWEFFWPLLAGACLVMARPEGHKDSAYLVSLIRGQQITIVHFVPSMLALFLEEPEAGTCKSLRRVFCSGEALPASVQSRFFQTQTATLHNLYGPTEAAIEVTFWDCLRTDRQKLVPIGKPIANVRIYLLDRYGQQVPIGVPGELFIGGVAPARGYINEPALTAWKFLPDPFSEEQGARMYRTGDLARYLPDGCIEFLGRIDDQIKIRGCRIEPGEVEAVLQQHPDIEECVVLAYTASGESAELIAYIVLRDPEQFSVDEIRNWLQHRLPDYMIPSAFTVLSHVPLTTSGKVDKKALPEPQRDRDMLKTEYVGPRSELERMLAVLWAEVLDLPRISVTDNFFSLGGHSLLAIQIVARIRKVFHVELPIRSLFEAPTVAALAEQIRTLHHTGTEYDDVLRVEKRPELIPLAPAQQRFWFLDRMDPGSSAYTIPLALHIKGGLQEAYCQQALQLMVQRHEVLRTTIATVKGKPVQRIAAQLHVPCPLLDLSDKPGAAQESVVMQTLQAEIERPFILSMGPLIRLSLLRLRSDEHILLVTMHHIISDGWSFDIFLQEFCTLYNALVSGSTPSLPALPVQYADYALWHTRRLEQHMIEEQLGYWKQQLADLAPLPLSTNMVQGDPPLAAFIVRLSPSLSEAARLFSRREGVTLFMLLLAVFQMVLRKWTKQEDIAVGTLVANRTRVEVEALIGCFINTLVLRTRLTEELSFYAFLRRVQAVTLEAYMHQDVPFDAVMSALRPSAQKLYSAMFALHTAPYQEPPTLIGLEMKPVDLRSAVARVELFLSLGEENGEINGALEYNSNLFPEAVIARLAYWYERLLQSVINYPERTLEEHLRLLDD